MRKKILLLAATLLMSTPAYAAPVTVKIDDTVAGFTAVIADGYAMAGMRDIFNAFGANVWWDNETRTAHSRGSDIEFSVAVDSLDATVNGETRQMPVPARTIDGSVMLPLGFIGGIFGYEASWDGENRQAVLSKAGETVDAPDMPVLDMSVLDTDSEVIEYADAIAKLVARNNSLKNLSDAAERMKEQRNEVWEDYIFTADTTTTMLITGVRMMSAIDFSVQNVAQQEERILAGAEAMLKNSLSTIRKTQLSMLQLEEAVRLSEADLKNNLELRFELGLISESDVRDAQRALEKSRGDLTRLKLSLDKEKEALALMLGYSADSDIMVRYEPEFIADEIDIESRVKDIPKAASIIILERAVEQAEMEYETSTPTFDKAWANQRQESKDEKANELAKARRELADAKESMEKSIRNAYSQIKTLEESHRLLELELEKAQDAYDTALTMLETGNATRHNVDQARLGILKAEAELQNNVYDLDILRFMLDRPYMLGA